VFFLFSATPPPAFRAKWNADAEARRVYARARKFTQRAQQGTKRGVVAMARAA